MNYRILLFRGKGPISRAIRWQTRSQYSHAALQLPSGAIVESWQGAGVQYREDVSYANVDAFTVPSMTKDQWIVAAQFCLSHIGDRYDYRGVFRFLTRVKPRWDNRWFCSELVFEALQQAGCRLLHNVTSGQVSPAMLSLSPLLKSCPAQPNTSVSSTDSDSGTSPVER